MSSAVVPLMAGVLVVLAVDSEAAATLSKLLPSPLSVVPRWVLEVSVVALEIEVVSAIEVVSEEAGFVEAEVVVALAIATTLAEEEVEVVVSVEATEADEAV
jgi:hypothetical protein